MTKRPKSNRAKVLGTPSLRRAKERPPISEFPEPIAELIWEQRILDVAGETPADID